MKRQNKKMMNSRLLVFVIFAALIAKSVDAAVRTDFRQLLDAANQHHFRHGNHEHGWGWGFPCYMQTNVVTHKTTTKSTVTGYYTPMTSTITFPSTTMPTLAEETTSELATTEANTTVPTTDATTKPEPIKLVAVNVPNAVTLPEASILNVFKVVLLL